MRRILTAFVILLVIPLVGFGQDTTKRILFFGDSITAGYGIGKQKAYPALIQQKIDSLGWNFKAVNAGLSGETSAGGLRRIDWLLQKPVSVFVLELGGNDGLRGIDVSATKQNLQKIIEKVKARYPKVRIIIAGMQVPPNLGQDYTERFKNLYPKLAEKYDTALIPFILKDVGGDPDLNQSDGIHPTARGHEMVAETVWATLQPVLQEISKSIHTN